MMNVGPSPDTVTCSLSCVPMQPVFPSRGTSSRASRDMESQTKQVLSLKSLS